MAQIDARKSVALFDVSPAAILTIDHLGTLLEVNPAAESMFGFRGEEVVGRCMGDLIVPPEFREAHFAAMKRVVSGGESNLLGRRAELIAQRMDGSRFPIELAISRIDLGEQPMFTGFVTDLTELKHRERELQSQQALATLEREIGLCIATTRDVDVMMGRCCELLVEHLQSSFARIWTLGAGESVLRLRASAGMYTHLDGEHSRIPLGEFKIGKIASECRPHLTNAVIGDALVHDQDWARREGMTAFGGYPLLVEGRCVGVLATFSKHALSKAALAAMAAIAHPIAIGIERKRVEDALRRHSNALLEADRRKNEFLAMLGHELRNPIQIVRHCTELLGAGKAGEQELRMVGRQADHLKRLVDDLLEISSMMLGRIKLVRQHVSLAACVREAVETMRPQVEARGQQLVLAPGDDDPHVLADEARLLQVTTNLIGNASKYSPDGTRICVGLKTEGEQAILTVSDEGLGIDSEFLPHVFEMFSQKEQSAHSSRGLGLGLSLVRRIVEQHGGSVEAYSEGPGKGSTFTVRLERTRPVKELQPSPPKQREAKDEAVKRRVLVVDDNEDAAQSLARLIGLLGGHEVEVVFDGQAAIEAAERMAPDLVLLDVNLPGMGGYEVAGRLREMESTRSATLVALTGMGRLEDIERSRSAGIDEHVVKPIERDTLAALLRGERLRGSGRRTSAKPDERRAR